MSAVNDGLDARAHAQEIRKARERALATDWRQIVSPEPPEIPAADLVHVTPADARRSWWREGYAAGMRRAALELETRR